MVILSRLYGQQCAGTKPGKWSINLPVFYDNLSPYGTWIDYPNYGHVWAPRIAGEFRPYATNGHWVYSDEGWAWASGYNWGWAPFHYGSWIYDDNYGWLWIPGYDWSPAWVTWGYVDDFYCWAPLMPGIDLSLQFDSWRPHSFYWNACSRDHIYDTKLSSYLVNPQQFAGRANRVSIINNFNTSKAHNLYYSKGPDVAEVQKYVARAIHQTTIRDVNNINRMYHERNNSLKVYRPSIQDPRETSRQNPQQNLQPSEYRKVETTESRPINTEDQRPVTQYNEQRNNIEKLPMHRSENNSNSARNNRGRN